MTSQSNSAGRDRGPSNRPQIIRVLAWVLGLGAAVVPAVAIVLVLAFLFTYLTVTVPGPGDIKQNQVATITDSKGGVLARVVPPDGNRTDVKYSDIPQSMTDAVKAAEDRDFDSNSGFSAKGFSRAVLGKLTGNVGAGGGSTVTQQYVKNAMVGDVASGLAGYQRKFKELAISTKMSRQWSKEDIMAAYLNTIYFGRGAYGIAAASKAYFNKPVNKLTVAESALMAAVIRGPSIYDPAVDKEASEHRWNWVLDGMVQTGALNRSERAEQKFPRTVEPRPVESDTTNGPNGLIKRQVLAELNSLGISEQQVRTEGLKITTSIVPQTQKSLVSAAKDNLSGEPKDLRTSSVSINPATGGVEGYFGGTDGQGWDFASTGLQTGSVFKVFALVAALEQDIPLSKRFSSAPFEAPGGVTVENSDGESCGTCNLATATKMSLNTVFYRLMMEDLKNGAEDVADAAHRAGIAESFGDVKQTLANANGRTEGGVVLGQYDSRVIDMASAYATLAASGIYREPYFVQKVETSTGSVLFDRAPNPGKRVFDAKVADNVTSALEPIAAYSNGNGLVDPDTGQSRPSAAKTGTAQLGKSGDNRYAWMVGYTPQLATATWVGTVKGDEPLRNYSGSMIYGSGLPAQIWKAGMDGALAGKPIEQFPEPEAVGGQAGVPYEPPPVTYTPTDTRTPTRSRPRLPGEGNDGNVTVAPGVTIPLPGNSGNGADDGSDNGDDSGSGDDPGDTGNNRNGRNPGAAEVTPPSQVPAA